MDTKSKLFLKEILVIFWKRRIEEMGLNIIGTYPAASLFSTLLIGKVAAISDLAAIFNSFESQLKDEICIPVVNSNQFN